MQPRFLTYRPKATRETKNAHAAQRRLDSTAARSAVTAELRAIRLQPDLQQTTVQRIPAKDVKELFEMLRGNANRLIGRLLEDGSAQKIIVELAPSSVHADGHTVAYVLDTSRAIQRTGRLDAECEEWEVNRARQRRTAAIAYKRKCATVGISDEEADGPLLEEGQQSRPLDAMAIPAMLTVMTPPTLTQLMRTRLPPTLRPYGSQIPLTHGLIPIQLPSQPRRSSAPHHHPPCHRTDSHLPTHQR